MKIPFLALFLIALFAYLILNFIFFDTKSNIDFVYFVFLALSFVIVLASCFYKNTIIKVISINLVLLLTFIFVIEVGFLVGIFSNVNIIRLPLALGHKPSGVIKINESPWYKFSANSLISSQGYRGQDFIYEWRSDQLGFKNSYHDPKRMQFSYLALGDSFTEGMGVSTEETWPSILSRLTNKKIYNAGVQGYAPSQFLGTLNNLKEHLSFDGVILGHLPTIYTRESNYLSKPQKATGGIESIRENKISLFFVTITNLDQSRGVVVTQELKHLVTKFFKNNEGKQKLKSGSHHIYGYPLGYREIFNRYLSEIPNTSAIDSKSELKKNPNWRALIKAYKEIIQYCSLNKKKVVIVAFPHRYETYFPLSTLQINTKNDIQYFVEYELLKEELAGMDVVFISTFESLVLYSRSAQADELPYFMQDGHLSKYGNQVVAKVISNRI